MNKKAFYPAKREKINWKVPSLFNNDKLILTLIDCCKELGIKQPIQSVYGGVKSPWSGGRPSQIAEINIDSVTKIIEEHNKKNISCCFTFSNYRICKDDLNDKQGNLLLKIAGEISENNYAIVSSDILYEHIKENYPKIKIISSILKPVYEHKKYDETPEYYNNLCKKYDKVVVRPEFYSDKIFMKKLKDKNKIEIMPNLGCLKNCPLSQTHYDMIADIDAGKETKYKRFCHIDMNKIESIYRSTSISAKDIDELIKLGFSNFKLQGRGVSNSELMKLIGSYIFEPTGYFMQLETFILRQLDLKLT